MLGLGNGFHLVQTGNFAHIFAQVAVRNVGSVDDGLGGQQEPAIHNLPLFIRVGISTGRFAAFQMGIQLFCQFGFCTGLLVAATKVLHGTILAALDGIHVGEDQLQIDGLNIPSRVDGAIHVDDVLILEAPHHMHDSIHFTDVAEELVAKTLAVAGTLHQSGNVHKLNGGGGHLLGMIHIGQHVQPTVRHHDHAGVGLDGAERIIGSLCACLRNCIEKCALSHIGKSHNAKFHIGTFSSRVVPLPMKHYT